MVLSNSSRILKIHGCGSSRICSCERHPNESTVYLCSLICDKPSQHYPRLDLYRCKSAVASRDIILNKHSNKCEQYFKLRSCFYLSTDNMFRWSLFFRSVDNIRCEVYIYVFQKFNKEVIFIYAKRG
jgi:hypothetical protein